MKIETIKADKAPAAIGPYAQAVRAGEWLFLSGQLGLDPQTGCLVSDDVGGQTRQALANLRAVLEAAGLDFTCVVETTLYLSDMADFPTVNALYGEAMGSHRPARATVAVSGLPKGACIEIKMTACTG